MTPTLRHLKVRTTRQLTHCSCCTRGYTDHQRNTTGGNIGWNASAAAERFREFFGNSRLQRVAGSFLGIWGLCNVLTVVTHSRKFFKLPSDLSGFFQDYWGVHSKTQSSIVCSKVNWLEETSLHFLNWFIGQLVQFTSDYYLINYTRHLCTSVFFLRHRKNQYLLLMDF